MAPKLEELEKDLKVFDVISLSGPGFLTKELFNFLDQNPESDILVLPKHFYYPLSNALRDQLTPENYMKYVVESIEPGQDSEVYGCHMWESNWVVT
jgi:hypothetical protein